MILQNMANCFLIQKESLLVRHYGVKLCLVIIKRVVTLLHECKNRVDVLPDGFVAMLKDNIIKVDMCRLCRKKKFL